MSVKYMILGGLMFSCSHGYEIKSQLTQKRFGEFGINDGQLYPALKKLEEEGLVVKTVEHQNGAPSRHVYSITDKGRADFGQWLESADGEDRAFRYDFFRKDIFCIKSNFLRFLPKKKAVEKIKHQIDAVTNTIADLKTARSHMIERKVDPLHVKVWEYGIMNYKTRLQWLNDFLKEVQKWRK
ncbi:MAG: PadR family transcriptional regulator [Smithellaceae bacterium]